MITKEKLFLKLITFGPLIFIPTVVAVVYLFSIEMYSQSFNNNVKRLEKSILEDEKNSVKNKVDNISDIIVYQKSVITNKINLRIKSRIEQAYKIANNIYKKYKDKKTDSEIQDMIKRSLEPFSWNDEESFIWIVDYNGIFQLAPNYLKHLEGKSILHIRDLTGRYVIKDEISVCKNQGEGYLFNSFTKPNISSKKQYEQIAYVKALGKYNWYLGTSEYLDTATKTTNKELLQVIDHVDNIDNNYILVLDLQGKLLLNKSIPQYVGKIPISSTDQMIPKVLKKILKEVKNDDGIFLSYDWINIKTQAIEKKHSYFKKIPNSDWIIGSGFYMSDVDDEIDKQKANMYEIYLVKSKYIAYVGIAILLISLAISYFLSRKLKESFIKFEDKIKKKTFQLLELNESLELKVHERTTELEELKDNFEKLATTDSLTKIHNRYSIMEILSDEVNRANRYSTPLSILMYDIDYFKKVNDTYGHKVGDYVLTELSKLIKNCVRDIDIVGRYGGEEFLVILPNTTLNEAENFAKRMLKGVREHTFDVVGNITISIGVVELKNSELVDEVFSRVDDLLYKSKESGRDRLSK